MNAKRSSAVELKATGPFGPVGSSDDSGVLSHEACHDLRALLMSSMSLSLRPFFGSPGTDIAAVWRRKKICCEMAVMSM